MPSGENTPPRVVPSIAARSPGGQLGEQRLDLVAPAGVGERPVGPRRRLQRALERLARAFEVALPVEEVAEEEVRVDAVRVQRQRLVEQLARLVVVAEADRPARHLVVERAEAGVGRAGERLRVDLQRVLQGAFCVLGERKRAEAALRAGVARDDDAVPDVGLGAIGVLRPHAGRACGQRLKAFFLLGARLAVFDLGPFALQAAQVIIDAGACQRRSRQRRAYRQPSRSRSKVHGCSPRSLGARMCPSARQTPRPRLARAGE